MLLLTTRIERRVQVVAPFRFLHEEYWMKAESFLERRLMNICRFIILELIVKMICQSYVAQNMFRVK